MMSTNKKSILYYWLMISLPLILSMLENENREIITLICEWRITNIIKRKISLILVDVQMPEMDEFVEIIKQHPNTSNIPLILLLQLVMNQSMLIKHMT
jgi:CheY-like chemotaxis protein